MVEINSQQHVLLLRSFLIYQKIYDAACQLSGQDAGDLLSKLLQPRPQDRPHSMDEVLSHDYFSKDEVTNQ
jgi:hypothetical protein